MFFNPKIWTTQDLAAQISDAGFHEGQNIVLHSSLKALGPTQNGPATIVDAIQLIIGTTGNLLVPTFTYSLPAWKINPYNHQQSSARTGAIPEYIRKLPDSIRSFHPTHSVAVLGPDALELTANHMNTTPLGIGSPFHRMLNKDASLLLLGTYQDTNSSLHLMEVLTPLAYTSVCFTDDADSETAWYHNSQNEIEFASIHEVPGCSRGFRSIEPHLLNHGVLKTGQIGNAACQILSMKRLAEACTVILHDNPTLLLCHENHCAICPKRRRFMQSLSPRK